MTIENGDSKAG